MGKNGGIANYQKAALYLFPRAPSIPSMRADARVVKSSCVGFSPSGIIVTELFFCVVFESVIRRTWRRGNIFHTSFSRFSNLRTISSLNSCEGTFAQMVSLSYSG